jgi:hypothetical protein
MKFGSFLAAFMEFNALELPVAGAFRKPNRRKGY